LESSSYTSSPAAFTTSHNAITSSNTYGLNSGRGSDHHFRGGHDKGFGNNHNCPIRCQICHVEGHYTSSCSDRYSRSSELTHLMEAFTSCSLNDSQTSNWYTDTSITTHVIHDATQLEKIKMYTGKDCVVVSNGASLSISHTNTFSPTSLLKLLDVLVVPGLTKNIISMSKFIYDFPYYITFIKYFFVI